MVRFPRPVLLAAFLLVLGTPGHAADFDRDGIDNAQDNCPEAANPQQLDGDADGVGNACDLCIAIPDAERQDADADGDGVGDACDACADSVPDVPLGDEEYGWAVDASGCTVSDRCPCDGPSGGIGPWRSAAVWRRCVRGQSRTLRRLRVLRGRDVTAMLRAGREAECGTRERSDDDRDGDGILDDGDESGITGDAPCTGGTRTACDDNCPQLFNRAQHDLDGDGRGDACDTDLDGDGVPNGDDVCPRIADPGQEDTTDAAPDGVGDACDKCSATADGADVDDRGCADGQTPDGSAS